VTLAKITNPVLYSTMTFLAYNINQTYYGGLHYMWCTPYFGSDYNSPTFMVPESSSPLAIYNRLKNEIASGDRHDSLAETKRIGVSRGVDVMLKRGKITHEEAGEIHAICQLAEREDFRPLLCVLPRIEVAPYSQTVDVKAKAHPLSKEYIVADVPSSAFDVIRIG
jgi:hypothetical protein